MNNHSPASLNRQPPKQSRLRSLVPRRLTLSTIFTFLLGGIASYVFITPQAGDRAVVPAGIGSERNLDILAPPASLGAASRGQKETSGPVTISKGKKHASAEEESETMVFHRAKAHGAPVPFEIYIHDPDQDEFTSGEIAERGTWHKEMCDLLTDAVEEARKTKKKGEPVRVLDCGANVGYITMWVAGSGKDVEVISVEPHPFHNSLLEKTLNLPFNAELAKRISLHKVALSTDKEAGKTLCMKVHPSNAAMTFVDKAMTSKENGNLPCTHVPVTTIDNILGTTKIDVMKIDVEGYEINVFAGGEKSLLKYPPKMIVMEYNYYILKDLYGKPVDWLVSMFKRGYKTIIDMANNKKMTTESEIRTYFEEKSFLKAVPSSHTDIILRLADEL